MGSPPGPGPAHDPLYGAGGCGGRGRHRLFIEACPPQEKAAVLLSSCPSPWQAATLTSPGRLLESRSMSAGPPPREPVHERRCIEGWPRSYPARATVGPALAATEPTLATPWDRLPPPARRGPRARCGDGAERRLRQRATLRVRARQARGDAGEGRRRGDTGEGRRRCGVRISRVRRACAYLAGNKPAPAARDGG